MTRRTLLIFAGTLAFLVAAVAAAVFLIPVERIGLLAVAHAEETLDREVRIENFRIRLLPRPAVALEGVSISRDARPSSADGAGPGASGSAAPEDAGLQDESGLEARVQAHPEDERLLAAVDRIDLRPRLLPLLRRNVVVDEVVLERPRLYLEIDEGGTLNLPTMEGDGEPATGDAEIRIRRLLVRDGSVVYTDANTGAVVTLAGIRQQLRLRGSITAGELSLLALRGEIDVEDIDAEMPEHFAFPIRGISLRIEHDAELNQTEDRLDLGRLRLTVQEVPLDVEGTVHALSDPENRELSLHAGAENIDIARLVASLPPELLDGLPRGSDGEPLRGSGGRASLAVAVSGRAGGEAVPDVEGSLRLDDVALAYGAGSGAGGNAVSGLDGEIHFSLDSLSTTGLTGRLLGEPFRVAFQIHDLAEPRGRAEVSGGLDLGEATRLGLLPEGMRGSGMVALDVTAAGTTPQVADARVDGSVALAGVELHLPDLLRPVQLRDARIRLSGQEVTAEDLRATLGRSDVAFDFRASDWLGFALGDTLRPPTVTFDARSTLFDADELLGSDPDAVTYGELLFAHLGNRPLEEHGGRTAPQLAEELGLRLPEIPNVRGDGRIRAHTVISNELTYEDVDVTVVTRDGDLDIRPARFRMMGGSVHLTARLERGPDRAGGADAAGGPTDGQQTAERGPTRPFTVEYAVNDVTAEPFLERFTLFRGHVGGTMLLAGYARMELEENMLPDRESVGSEGTVAFLDGELQNWPLVRELGDRISAAGFETLAFQDWSGRFRIAGARILLEETMLEAGELAVRAAGSFDVAGNLNLGATVYLPEGLASGIPGAPAGLLAALSGPEDRIPVGARIGGTATRPSISLDLSEAGAAAAGRAREAAEAEARDQASRLAEELGVELPAGDSLAAAADSARQRVQEDVQNRLRRLLRPPGGGD